MQFADDLGRLQVLVEVDDGFGWLRRIIGIVAVATGEVAGGGVADIYERELYMANVSLHPIPWYDKVSRKCITYIRQVDANKGQARWHGILQMLPQHGVVARHLDHTS